MMIKKILAGIIFAFAVSLSAVAQQASSQTVSSGNSSTPIDVSVGNFGVVSVQISGITGGATYAVVGVNSINASTTLPMYPATCGASVTSGTTNASYIVPVSGYQQVKVNVTVGGSAIVTTAGGVPPSWGCSNATISGTVGGYDSGPVSAVATPANSSHAAGTSVGGLYTIAIARTTGGSGLVNNLIYKSTGGSTGNLTAVIWRKLPANTTCTDNVAFAPSDVDDADLITAPVSIAPVAVAGYTTATFAQISSVAWSYTNTDTSPSKNLYVCVVTVATDTADENAQIRVTLSGAQD